MATAMAAPRPASAALGQDQLKLYMRVAISTPMKPASTASQRRQPTRSPSMGTESMVTINGMVNRMAPVAIMLLGTGTLAGIIANSGLKDVLISGLTASGLPSYLLAPISGALMSLATASTTAGTVVASNVFSSTLIELGISSLAGAAMIHAGATVFDHMPHGSFFHATGGSVHMGVGERLKLIPYETAVGLTIATVSTLMFGVFGLA